MSILDLIPAALLYGLAASTLCLVLTALACAFVWLATDAGVPSGTPEVRPPAVQPGPPIR